MLFPYNILAFTEIGLPPTYVYVRRMGIVIMPECCVNASLFLIAELRPANFSDAFWCQKIVSLSTAENPRVLGFSVRNMGKQMSCLLSSHLLNFTLHKDKFRAVQIERTKYLTLLNLI